MKTIVLPNSHCITYILFSIKGWENILFEHIFFRPGLEYNFEKKKWNSEVIDYGVPYDYSSIMHYPWTAFSKDRNKKTLEPIRNLNGKTPYVKLSDDDALQANRMYKCSGSCRLVTLHHCVVV